MNEGSVEKSVSIVRDVLEKRSVPIFSSPIYIGMTKNLRVRIEQHRKALNEDEMDLSSKDAREFGERIKKREIKKEQLIVWLQIIECKEEEYKFIEYLLNRINFPLIGEN